MPALDILDKPDLTKSARFSSSEPLTSAHPRSARSVFRRRRSPRQRAGDLRTDSGRHRSDENPAAAAAAVSVAVEEDGWWDCCSAHATMS